MAYEPRDITPADYIPGDDGILRIDPEMRDRLHCYFIVALKERASRDGWTMRLIYETDRNSGFPGVSIYPPGQDGQTVLTSYRIEGGLPDELTKEEALKPFVGRSLRIYTIKQRAFAGPLDFHLPAILLEKLDASAYADGSPGGYDPTKWAEHVFLMTAILHKHKADMLALENKYPNLQKTLSP